jgi:hypothetical protein
MTATRAAAVVRPDPGYGQQVADTPVVDQGGGDHPLDGRDLGLDHVVQAERRAQRERLMARQRERGQPGPPRDAERVGHGRSQQGPGEDRRHPVALGGAAPDECGPLGDQRPQLPRPLVGLPDLGEVVGGQQLREHRGIDLVGLGLRVGDGPRPERVADHHPAGSRVKAPRCGGGEPRRTPRKSGKGSSHRLLPR